jgi:hypothetical protein
MKWLSRKFAALLVDPATPHSRIVTKESKVIRVVQRRGEKTLKID